MPKQKWDISGKGKGTAGGGNYAGPMLPKGSYPAKIKRITIGKIGENKQPGQQKGPNDGKPRLSILLEVQTANDPDRKKYHGHPIWDGLNIIEGSEGFVNGFLHALTNGSQKAKDAIESAFWDDDKGPDYKRVRITKGKNAGKIETHVTKIGRVTIDSPKGEHMVQVTTKVGEYKGTPKVEVAGYIPFDASVVAGFDSKDEDADEDDDLLETADEDADDDDDDADDVDDDAEDDDEDDDDIEDAEDDDEDAEDDDEDDEDDDADDDEPAVSGRGRKPF